jgi:alkylhydroperoxidase family enzyme
LPDFRTSSLFSDAERLALELSDATSAASVTISDALFEALQKHFDQSQLVELAATAALENYRARFNRVFQIEPNSLYCPITNHH